MTTLLRFDPFRELDRMFDEARASSRRTRVPTAFPMDAYRHGDTIVLHFDLPGVDPSSIDLEHERNVLTVSAERSWRPVEGDDVIATERVQGRFRRQLMLGDGLATDRMHASYEHGVLTVTIPVAEQAKPRKIEVQVHGQAGPTPVEAGAREAIETSGSAG
ncbi:MAG: Hsp20/alpha crystallin family protein [Acidimicrobiales bacterium]